MIPNPSPRIATFIAASYRPETRPSRKKSVTTSSVMGEPAKSLPTRTRSKRSASSSLSSQSTSSSQEQQQQQLHDHHHYQHSSNPKPADRTLSNPSPAAVARAARPGLASRTSSAPAIPQSQRVSRPGGGDDDDDDEHLDDENDDDEHHSPTSSDRPQRPEYRSRDSVASIKDDPFFRNYQTPHSVSLGRELMAATYEREEDEDAELVSPLSPPPRAVKKPSVDEGVNLPVSDFPICKKRWCR